MKIKLSISNRIKFLLTGVIDIDVRPTLNGDQVRQVLMLADKIAKKKVMEQQNGNK